jgi:hypothetical protein
MRNVLDKALLEGVEVQDHLRDVGIGLRMAFKWI